CLAVGVAAVVAVAGLSSSLDSGLRAEARQLLAADLVVEGSQPLPPGTDLLRSIDLPGVRRTDVKEMVTVVSAPGVAGWPGRPGVWISTDGTKSFLRASEGMTNTRVGALSRSGDEVLVAVNDAGP